MAGANTKFEEQELEPEAELQVHRLLEGEPWPPDLWCLCQPPPRCIQSNSVRYSRLQQGDHLRSHGRGD